MVFVAMGVVGLLSLQPGPPAVEVIEHSEDRPGVVFSMPSINVLGEVVYLADDIRDELFPEIRFAPGGPFTQPFTLASEATGFRTPKFWIEEPRSVFINDFSEVVAAGTIGPLGIAERTYLVFMPDGSVRDATPASAGVPAVRSLSGGGSINNFGSVAFGQQGEGSPLEVGVFKYREGLEPLAMVDVDNSPYQWINDTPPLLLNDGRVLFRALENLGGLRSPNLVLAGPEPGQFTEIVDSDRFPYPYIDHASASLGGEIAFSYRIFSNQNEIYRWNEGAPTPIISIGFGGQGSCGVASLSADYINGGFAINNEGLLVYVAESYTRGPGLYVRDQEVDNCDTPPILAIGAPVPNYEWLGKVSEIHVGPRALNNDRCMVARVIFESSESAILRLDVKGCPADLNRDSILDRGDIAAFVDRYLFRDPSADLNGDGVVDSGDIRAFVQLFLDGC